MRWPPDDYPDLAPLQDRIPLPAPTEADRLAGARAAVTKAPKPIYRKS